VAEQGNLWYFEDVDLYNIFCPHKVPDMQERHTFQKYDKGEFIFMADEPHQHVYLISEGRVKIGNHTNDGEEVVKAILGRGEIFGELAVAGENKTKEFAKAMDKNTVICPLTVEDLKMLMKDNKDLNFAIIKVIGWKFRKIERRVEAMVFKDSKTRVVEFLLEMGEEKGIRVGYETMIKNHYTHKDISRLTGTSRQTVTTVFNQLRDDNIITFDRRRILIRDMDQLRQVSLVEAD